MTKKKSTLVKPPHAPIKYLPSMCASLIMHMGKGLSYITWGPSQKKTISVSTMYEWENVYPDWKEAKKEGYSKALEFYESLLAKKAKGKTPGELNAIIFALKTRFHKEYGEQQKIDHTSNGKTLQILFVKSNVSK